MLPVAIRIPLGNQSVMLSFVSDVVTGDKACERENQQNNLRQMQGVCHNPHDTWGGWRTPESPVQAG